MNLVAWISPFLFLFSGSGEPQAAEAEKAASPPAIVKTVSSPKKKVKRNLESGVCGLDARNANRKLLDLGYLPRNLFNKECFDTYSYHATMAFQKYSGIAADGVIGPATRKKLYLAKPPSLKKIPGWKELSKDPSWSEQKIVISLEKQILLLTKNNQVQLVSSASSGAPGYDTPPGIFSVFRKEEMSWSIPYDTWMPWATYFNGGIATHESPDVPAYPASHGCVRLPEGWAKIVYDSTPYDTTVIVLP